MTYTQEPISAVGGALSEIPVYVHTHRISSNIDGLHFLLRHQSRHKSPSHAIDAILEVLGYRIAECISAKQYCAIDSRLGYVSTEVTTMDEFSDYCNGTTMTDEELEDAYFDMMCEWQLREEVSS